MELGIEFIGEEDVMEEGGIEKKKKYHKKYHDIVNRINLVEWIKEEIGKKPERSIVVKISDIAKEMGPEFEKIGYTVLYQALKPVLFQYGIFLSMATHKDGDKTFILRDVKEGDELAPSYLYVKNRSKKGEKERNGKDIEEDDIQEKSSMRGEIKKLREILHGRLGRKSCMVEIFQFNWDTLTWRMIKRLSIRTHLKLIEIIMNNTSSKENRYRIEVTPLDEMDDMEKELLEEGEKNEGDSKIYGVDIANFKEISDTLDELKGSEKEQIEENGDIERVEKIEKAEQRKDKKEGEIECPRCGGKSIKTWPTVQIIKTRSGDRKLRHRCTDCNETFSDEDLGINQS